MVSAIDAISSGVKCVSGFHSETKCLKSPSKNSKMLLAMQRGCGGSAPRQSVVHRQKLSPASSDSRVYSFLDLYC